MLRNSEDSTPDIRKLQFQVAGLTGQLGDLADRFDSAEQTIRSLLSDQAQTPASPVANLLWNGELGHSVHTWNDAADPSSPTNKNEECAWWFSHNVPTLAKTFVDANVTPASDQIGILTHGFTTGSTVDLLNTGGALPAGLATATTYFVIVVDEDTIKLASSLANAFAGTAVNITAAAGGGTHTIQQKLISSVTSATNADLNNELKSTTHTQYDKRYCRWDATNGWAELTDTMTVDALLPSNMVDATTPLARISMIAARRNSYIELPDDCLFAAGIWDNTSAQRKFLASSVGFTAELAGTAGSVTRKYKIYITSDRGYSILSDEITISNAPSDAQFSSTRNIVMAWPQQAGQLQVEIYEYLPAGGDGASAAQYRLLTQISAATSYIHQGSYLRTVSGYPTATDTTLTATYFTQTGELASLAVNGVDSAWDTLNFPIAVPSNYNKGNTTDRQWARIWLTVAPNLFITGCTTDGSTTITAPTAGGDIPTAFASEYDSLFDAGTLVAQVYDSTDTLIATTTVASRTSDTAVVLGTSIAAGSNRKLRIVGGGFHGVYIDKIHLGYQQNTSYAPNPLDVRTLQPRAAPSSGTQGGVGGGGDGGGIHCISGDMPVKLHVGIWKEIKRIRPGSQWASTGAAPPNVLLKLKTALSKVRRVRSANGLEIIATDTEKFIVSREDVHGTALYRLRVGDPILTEIDDRIEETTISEISAYLDTIEVYTPSLSNSHIFIAGRRVPLGFWRQLWCRISGKWPKQGGFVLHNQKGEPEF